MFRYRFVTAFIDNRTDGTLLRRASIFTPPTPLLVNLGENSMERKRVKNLARRFERALQLSEASCRSPI